MEKTRQLEFVLGILYDGSLGFQLPEAKPKNKMFETKSEECTCTRENCPSCDSGNHGHCKHCDMGKK